MSDDVVGGAGWVIRAATLRPEIIDAEVFARSVCGDPLAMPLMLLWTGRPTEALHLLNQMPETLRSRALRADCYRDLGQTAEALLEYDRLVAETMGSAREAVMRQHRGKSRLANGDTQGAIDDFEEALALRSRAGGDQALLESTKQALNAARTRQSQTTDEEP